jgi:sporulation protein YlmC with PRC-barrel domain
LKNVTVADLDKAPGFDKNHWPTVANENWLGIERGSTMAPSGGAAAQAPRSSVEERTGTVPESPQSMAPMATEPRSERDQSATPGMTPERGMRPDTGYSAGQPVDIEHLRLSKLMGINIRNLQDENLGKLDNVVIDVNQGKLAYGIVAIRSGFLGLNKDFVAVPWSALNWAGQPGIARLDADKQTLTAIAFDKDHFPNLADPQYSRQLFDRFHATPYWEGQNLGFIPGQESRGVNPPSSEEMKAPNAAPNSAATEENIAHHMDKHALSYNPNSVETIRGTIQSVGTYHMEGTSVKGVLLHVRADDGRVMMVQAGPRPYVDSQNIRFQKGETVTITGSVAKTDRHETILASRIQTADKTLALRAPDGRPLWNLDQYQGPASARGDREYRNAYEY